MHAMYGAISWIEALHMEGKMFRGLFFGKMFCAAVALITASCLLAASTRAHSSDPKPESHARKGMTDGIWYWTLPNTPNGLRPVQSWSGAGSTPDGQIFVAGEDHTTNSALYRLRDQVLRYVGDARSASEAANNWEPGEVAEKFHTRPTWVDHRVYVTSMSHSTMEEYLTRRGFHWYAYDIKDRSFSDLSASQPGGVGAKRGGLITIAPDPSRNLIYGAINPTGDILRYHIDSGRKERLGRPDYQRPDVYPGRFMWVDSRGRLYFSAGNDEEKHYGAPYDPAIFNHIRYYDPAKWFGEMPNWTLHNQRAIDAGKCFPKERVCYLSDNVGHIYKFAEAGPTWRYLGSIGQESILHGNPSYNYTWVFHVTNDKKKAYIVTNQGHFYDFDLGTGHASFLADLKKMEPELAAKDFLYGHDAWDNKGRFFFSAFKDLPTDVNTVLVAIDPKRLTAALRK
jgi:hypothetical protein